MDKTMTHATMEPVNAPENICDGECSYDGYYEPCEECMDYQEPVADYPVSGDETLREFGRAGRRSSVNIWRAPGVRPKRATSGIRVGSTIDTWHGTGVVTRVGSIAGFYMLNGKEQPWAVAGVRNIHV